MKGSAHARYDAIVVRPNALSVVSNENGSPASRR